jgi:hypothetical protein
MKRITPAILAAAMVAGYGVAGYAQTQTPPNAAAGVGVSGGASGSAKSSGGTGVNAGTAEGQGRLSGGASIGAGRETPVSGAAGVGIQGQTEAKKEDNRKRSITGAASGEVGAGAGVGTTTR